VMAAFVILPPPHRRTMKSQDNPRSTSASTSATKTRVPFERRFAVADHRVGDNISPQFHACVGALLGLAHGGRLHARGSTDKAFPACSPRGRSPPETMNFQSEERNGADAKAQRSRGARISAARHHQPLGGSI
jgi:hypothetical protein